MSKVLSIAIREFLATAATKAFIFGMLALPAIGGILLLIGSLGLFDTPEANAEGTILVLDKTSNAFVATGLEAQYSAEAVEAQRARLTEEIGEQTDKIPIGNEEQRGAATEMMVNSLVPSVTIERLPLDTDIEAQKARVKRSDNDVILMFVVDEGVLDIPYSE